MRIPWAPSLLALDRPPALQSQRKATVAGADPGREPCRDDEDGKLICIKTLQCAPSGGAFMPENGAA